ncbi:SDR family NAD(P)-dependent oxidoreductase [Siminovitchia terrae]|uniref:SDR family NAD(P)-dependent oxidoreductase n=1 Tax=Siminovitchia terrae TaxID=1914933 RepID=A0A429X7U6_SIMTE|nr:SDR family NAD(P)-dependent oxidoreductase [Siminovitchia terrae]RST59497.1 SDR family NAD(P)-dependent oxidoreductase [Siminovitchia terrae]
MEKKVLVTGGAGFIGSHIVDKLLEEGFRIFVIDNMSTGEIHNISLDRVQFYKVDIRDSKQVNKVMESVKPDYIIHQAAQVSVAESIRNIVLDEEINIKGSLNIIEAARRFEVKKIVFASSAAVYGNPQYVPIDEEHPLIPMSPYGLSKYTVEKYLNLAYELYGLQYTILRYSNVYGPRQNGMGEGGVIAKFVNAAIKDLPITIHGDGEQTRDFVYVKDVADANVKALKYGNNNVFNISTGVSMSVNELVVYIEDVFSKQLKKNKEAVRFGDIKNSLLLNSKAKAHLSWNNNIPISKGLESMHSLAFNKG